MNVKESEVGERDVTDEDAGSAESEVADAAPTTTGSAESKVESEVESAVDPEPDKKHSGKEPARLRLSVSLRSLVVGAVIVALVAGVGVLAWLYIGAQQKLDAQTRASENNAHAEKIALDYAVNAAAMNFQDMNAWKVKLVAGTTPELKHKLTKAAESMEQLLVPLQWTSTAQPLVAKVRSNTGGTYVVDCFVSVLTKTVQAPDPLQSTATYSVTINSGNNWQISDVGGIGAVVEQK